MSISKERFTEARYFVSLSCWKLLFFNIGGNAMSVFVCLFVKKCALVFEIIFICAVFTAGMHDWYLLHISRMILMHSVMCKNFPSSYLTNSVILV